MVFLFAASDTKNTFNRMFITNELEQHQQQSPPNIDVHQLIAVATDFIDKDHYQLRIELEPRRQILAFDANDHPLVETFHKLRPRTCEVCCISLVFTYIYYFSLFVV